MYFVSDIDGTLLAQPGDRVIEGVPEALRRLQKCGVKLVLASGRSIHDVTLAAARLGVVNYYAIASNGRVVAEMDGARTKEPIYINYDVSYGFNLAKSGRKVIFQGVDGKLTYLDSSSEPQDIWNTVEPISEVNLRNSVQASFMVEFEGTWAQSQQAMYSNWHPWKYEGRVYLQDMSIDKGVGLVELVKARGAEGIAAIGDDFNDLSMFKLAGEVYLMGNAKPEVQVKMNQRHTVVGDVESGGAIEAINHLMEKYSSVMNKI